MSAGTFWLLGILATVTWCVWKLAGKEPDWRNRVGPVCRAHGGDAIEQCETCRTEFCRECRPDGHCGFQPRETGGEERWRESL
jgi:hypothetical protein